MSDHDLHAALATALEGETDSSVTIEQLHQMAGGASQEMWQLDLAVKQGVWRGDYPLVLRRQLGGKIYADALDLHGEYQVVEAAYNAGVPAPRPYWFLADLLGRPAALMQRLEGETIGRRIVKAPALAAARERLPAQMGTALAAVHRIDPDAANVRALLPAPPANQSPANAATEQLERDLDRIGEPHPALELGLRWMRRNEPPPPDRLVVVHGDYRLGNMLVTPEGLNGVLDWEFAHIGDPAEDLAWGMIRDWRFGVDHLCFAGVSQPAPFLAAYAEHGGEQVDAQRVAYWEVMGNMRWAIGTLNQARRHLSGEAANLEFASLGRRCAELELEVLLLIGAKVSVR